MTLRCRPGDIAECIAGQFVGARCEVLHLSEPLILSATGEKLSAWYVAFAEPMAWRHLNVPEFAEEGLYPDRWLRPIRPDAEPVEVERGEPMEVQS